MLSPSTIMVSYYNSLAMFPQPSRPGSGPPPPSVSASSLYSSYSHYNQYSAVAGQSLHDQNSNLQLYAGFSPDTAFSPAPGSHAPGPAPGWPHSWSQFPPGSCRGAYDWGGGVAGEPAHPPPPATPTSASEAGLPSPHCEAGAGRQEAGSPVSSPSDYSVPAVSSVHFKPSLSPGPGPGPLLQHYKTEPASSTTDLGLPTSPSGNITPWLSWHFQKLYKTQRYGLETQVKLIFYFQCRPARRPTSAWARAWRTPTAPRPRPWAPAPSPPGRPSSG